MLLEKINSTSTLGSFIMLTTVGDVPALPPPAANGASMLAESGPGEQPGASQSHEPHTQADGIVVEADSIKLPVPLSPVEELPSWAPSYPPRLSVSSHATSEPNAQPTLAAETITAPTPVGPTKPQKRVKMAQAAKKTAKGAGIVLVVIFGIVTFPLMVPAYMKWRRRRRQKMSAASPSEPDIIDQHPAPVMTYNSGDVNTAGQPSMPHAQHQQAWYPSPTTGYHSYGTHDSYMTPYSYATAPSHMTYDSSRIPAELPGLHELAQGSPDVELVGRLLNTGTDRPSPNF